MSQAVTIRQPRSALVVGTLAVLAGAAVPYADPVLMCMVITAGLIVAAAIARHEQILLSPLGPYLLVVLTSGLLPAALGYLSATPSADITQSDYAKAGVMFLLFSVVSLGIYIVPTADRPRRLLHRMQEDAVGRGLLVWTACAAIAALTVVSLVLSVGFGEYLTGLATRRVYLEGKAWATWAFVGPSVASLVVIGSMGESMLGFRSSSRRLAIVLVVISTGFILLTGNRMNLVTYIAALAIVIHKRVRPLRAVPVVAGIVVVGLIGLALPTFLRASDPYRRSLRYRSLGESFTDIETKGPVAEFGQIAGLAMVAADPPEIERQYGGTYLAGATIVLPRAFFPWKLPGAGEIVTEALFPYLWLYAGTGIQISAPGEGYLNFGWAGVVLAAIAFGLGMRFLLRLSRRADLLGVLLFAVSLPRVALYLRGEFANVTGFWVMELMVIAAAYFFLRTPARGHERERTLAPPASI